MKSFDSRKWLGFVIGSTAVILMICGVCVFILDPFFHYREPANDLIYGTIVRNDSGEGYMNSGIVRNFDFNAVIAGSSMVENFKTSEFDNLFCGGGIKAVKLPQSGGSFKEVNTICSRAFMYQPDLKIVLRSMDLSMIDMDKDTDNNGYDKMLYYLDDDNRLNDLNYLLNKEAILRGCGLNVIMATIRHRERFSFDSYGNWNDSFSFGKEEVLASYERPVRTDEIILLSDADRKRIRENIEQNVTTLAKEYPNTRFIYFMTPYSICYWDSLKQNGRLQKAIQEQEEVIELLLSCENIELYSFCDNFELICDLDHYRDIAHYSEDINSQMLKWIAGGKYRITADNYREYLDRISSFYETYDYNKIFRQTFP